MSDFGDELKMLREMREMQQGYSKGGQWRMDQQV